jgi:hypothetical protein
MGPKERICRTVGRLATGGAHVHAALAQMVEQRRRHLAAARVVDAHEQHLGHAANAYGIDVCQFNR